MNQKKQQATDEGQWLIDYLRDVVNYLERHKPVSEDVQAERATLLNLSPHAIALVKTHMNVAADY